MRRNRQDWQEIAGALAAWALAALAVTGLVLYGIPWTDEIQLDTWEVLGLDAAQWADLHRVAGGLLLAAAAAALALGRLVLTRRPIMHGLAGALVLLLAVTTLLRWPPAGWLLPAEDVELAEAPALEQADDDLPYPGSAQEPLSQVAQNLGMETTRVSIALQEAGLQFEGLDQSMAAIARANGTTPQAVYAAIRHLEAPAVTLQTETTLDLIESRFAGRDIRAKTIAALADEASVPLDTALRRLRDAGITAEPSATAATVAEQHGLSPMDVLVLLVIDRPAPRGEPR